MFEEILNDDTLSIQGKLDKLDALRGQIESQKKDLTQDYTYCPYCGEYYKNRAWTSGSRTVRKSICINSLTGGYLDDYEYEYRDVLEFYKECPVGHRIQMR